LLTIGAELLCELTPWPALIDAISMAFREPCEMPSRLHYDVSVPGASAGTLLLMPAWTVGGLLGVKIVQAFPGNSSINKPAIHGVYMLASARDGEVLAMMDAQELTARRTAATSALAAGFLSRPASRRLLVMGTGRLAFNMAAAHASVRPIQQVSFWGRNRERAMGVATQVRNELGIDAEAVDDLPEAISGADIISTVTTARDPILPGRFLSPGTHVDLVGGFTPEMRETDDDTVKSAHIYVDDSKAAPQKAGDIRIPIDRGLIRPSDIKGDLFALCQQRIPGRSSDDDITLFKSVGVALEDLAAASLAWNTLADKGGD
jgi:alanine dehydrogenase